MQSRAATVVGPSEALHPEALIEGFYQRIYAFLRRLTHNEADAADLTQRTFSKAWQSWSTFAGRSSASSWLHSIAYHVYVDWRRADGRLEARPSEWWSARVSPGPLPDETAACSDSAAYLYSAVDALDQDLRDSVHLHYYQELTLQETAEAMGVALSTVKYRLRQALDALHSKMSTEKNHSKIPTKLRTI